ncbi:hypothetical protein TNCV_497451 [Trichonephila clavipes]|nr:hypothetical protein TNCV_497451 [Trichonephila clavipes]
MQCLAVIWALNKFRTYFGPLPVKVITDHAALTRLTNGKNLSSRMISNGDTVRKEERIRMRHKEEKEARLKAEKEEARQNAEDEETRLKAEEEAKALEERRKVEERTKE